MVLNEFDWTKIRKRLSKLAANTTSFFFNSKQGSLVNMQQFLNVRKNSSNQHLIRLSVQSETYFQTVGTCNLCKCFWVLSNLLYILKILRVQFMKSWNFLICFLILFIISWIIYIHYYQTFHLRIEQFEQRYEWWPHGSQISVMA